MKIENYYYLIPSSGQVTLLNSRARHICVSGDTCGQPNYPDGSFIRTSTITTHQGDQIVTKTGSTYKLGAKHPDYEELERAIRIGTPILTQ